jgi:L-alanine-DL-glutamate epimerase-like enolase superfamily enzyme
VLRIANVDVSRADGTQDAFLLRLHTDEGLVGIGEADTSPYLARTMIEMPSSHAVARGLEEVLVGEDPSHIDRLWDLLFQATYHYGRGGVALHVISAIDMALWDLAGKVAGKPVHELLGTATVEPVPVYASEVMPETPDEVRGIAERAVAAGYRALKLGWGPLGKELRRDEELVRAAREVLGLERELMLDGGMGYTVESALELLDRLEDVRLYWLEEPFAADDYDSYRRLADATETRIAAGEADSGLKPFRALVDAHVNVLQPDLARCGSFTVGRGIAALQRESEVDVVPHCFSTGVLVTASLQFVAALPRPTWSEYSVAESPFVNGVLAQPYTMEDGMLRVPTGPGLGIELDEDMIEAMTVD